MDIITYRPQAGEVVKEEPFELCLKKRVWLTPALFCGRRFDLEQLKFDASIHENRIQIILAEANVFQELFLAPALKIDLPAQPSKDNIRQWRRYEKTIGLFDAAAERQHNMVRSILISRIFDYAFNQMPEDKNVIVIRSDYVPNEVDEDLFNIAVQTMAKGLKPIKPLITLGSLKGCEWFAIAPKKLRNECIRVQDIKSSFKGSPASITITYA